MQGVVESSTNAFRPMNVLAGISRVHITASVDLIVLAIEESMQKFCNAATLIALVKDDTTVGKKTILGS